MENILGIDLGSGSIGTALRNPQAGNTISEQLSYFSSDIFDSGVGKKKAVEYSFAAERSACRLKRRLYETRRRKLWATLSLLIDYNLCPMSKDSLTQWSTYDKSRGLTRQYPVNDKPFAQWIKLDFDGDGIVDYSSPYQLRRELVEKQLDFSKPENRYKLGRALYHIAQHRGFKSSKGETISERENSRNGDEGLDVAMEMKKSETKLSSGIVAYIEQHNLKTVGQAFAYLELEGERIRNNESYKAVRTQMMDEIQTIFEFQDGLNVESELFTRLLSTKKGVGTIFYKKPLRSQKGTVGKCVLESGKTRCPSSHPFYEIFKAWSLINNIKWRKDYNHEWIPLTLPEKEDVFFNLFITRVKSNFKFEDVRKYLEKNVFKSKVSKETGCSINYKDTQSLDGCPVSARLYKLFVSRWADDETPEWKGTKEFILNLENKNIKGSKSRTAHGAKDLTSHQTSYSALDVWHICYETEEPEDLDLTAHKRLGFNEDESKQMIRIWSAISQGYASLSLCALTKINRFLILGLKYNDAVLLAKVPEIANISEEKIIELKNIFNTSVRDKVDYDWQVTGIINNLIANYKALPENERFAFKDYNYTLDSQDRNDIEDAIVAYLGANTWESMSKELQQQLFHDIEAGYQNFFTSRERTFLKPVKLDFAFKSFLSTCFADIPQERWNKLYHHSAINIYPPQTNKSDRSQWRLGSPNIGSIRNPVVLRTLNKLRHKINAMLDAGMISYDDTRIVVETAREFNDANMRWAIETYQNKRNDENAQIRKILEEFFSHQHQNKNISETDIDKVRFLIEQGSEELLNDKSSVIYNSVKDKDIKKYKLWLEQGCQCMYTGKIIGLSELFAENLIDIEHTIPRSMCFDNSDQNLTVCDAHYNRSVKRNLIPSQLPNYSTSWNGYTPIEGRLKIWEERVERLKDNVEFWKNQSRRAATKDRKDTCIRQRHLWRMEYDYWRKKLERFKLTEVTDGFKNSQLVDTRIITKYAALYLKSVFNAVDVQRGNDTAEFRKIFGLQSSEEKKDRTKHSHHAIDAAVLTLIPRPNAAKRLRETFAKLQEAKKFGSENEVSCLKNKLKFELKECHIASDISSLSEYIENNILVNRHALALKALRPNMYNNITGTHKRLVVKGKKRNIVARGDSIRGRLHKETFFGAIQLPNVNGNGLQREYVSMNGGFKYPKTEDKYMVTRKLLADMKEADLESIVDTKLRQQIYSIIQRRMADGLSFKEAIATEIWMLDKNGKEIKFDHNGRPLRPIRHVRCLVKAGRGYMTYEKSLQIRHQTTTSEKRLVNLHNRDYKNIVYAQNDTNYIFLLYEGIDRGKLKRKSRIINLFEIAQLSKGQIISDFYNYFIREPYYASITEKGVIFNLSAVITVGTKVLLWNESPDEITELINDNKMLSERLYSVYKFNTTGADLVYLVSHLTDEREKELTVSTLNCLIEHRDFEIDLLGNIIFRE